ncbi:MAG: hypothetical protein KatS3mg063_1879 [Tepidiforma sp.]|jgi:hypothetical protein|nr:MAG: hypothetical protein KatS3mg063_1879 [Tepidiforma sp.]
MRQGRPGRTPAAGHSPKYARPVPLGEAPFPASCPVKIRKNKPKANELGL